MAGLPPAGEIDVAGVHHRHRGRCGCAQCNRHAGDGRRPVRHQPAASAARPHRPRSASIASLCLLASWTSPGIVGRPAARAPSPKPVRRIRPRRPRSQGTPGRRRAGPKPVRQGRSRCPALVAGRSPRFSSRRPATSATARLRRSVAAPRDWLCWAARFTDTDRIEYLDKPRTARCCCGCRRSRCSRCWSPIRRWDRRRPGTPARSRRAPTSRRFSPVPTCSPESPCCSTQRVHRYDYRDRAAFGDAWTDDNTAPDGHNGCDTRNDILDRDLVDKTFTAIKRCPTAVATGTLHDPYTNLTVAFQRGAKARRIGADRPHRPAGLCLGHGGLRTWSRFPSGCAFANDPANLLAVDGQGQPGQGRSAAGAVDAAQHRVRVSVLGAVHRGAAGLPVAGRSGIEGRVASGRRHLPGGVISRL